MPKNKHKSKFQKYFKTYVKMTQIKKFREHTSIRNKKYLVCHFRLFQKLKLNPKTP